MARRAAELRGEGEDVIDLTLGEPDFSAPEHVLAAARNALQQRLGYTPANGLPALRSAIRRRLAMDRGLHYQDDQVAVGCGAKQIICNAFTATLKAGDEVLVPAPYWASYPDMIRICGASPLIVPTTAAQGFRLTAEQLASALQRARSPRWLVLNAPGNPSGTLYSKEDLAELARVLELHADQHAQSARHHRGVGRPTGVPARAQRDLPPAARCRPGGPARLLAAGGELS